MTTLGSAVAGVSYTIQAANLETHADPHLESPYSCGGLASSAPGRSWTGARPPPESINVGVGRSAEQRPLTGYSLTVSADTSGLYDPYEPDDTCTAARDISTDGSPQTHYFQTVGDVDWVKFPIVGGETYIVVAGNTGLGVSPNVARLRLPAPPPLARPWPRGWLEPAVDSTAPGVLYARATNAGLGYGISATYDLRVNTVAARPTGTRSATTPPATAGTAGTTGAAATHTTCPAGDQDWVKFAAISGQMYVLETSSLGPSADTEIVLYGPDQTTELARNDDYTSGLLNSRIVWTAPAAGTYYAKIGHVKAQAAGANTRYDFAIYQGACRADAFDNGGPGQRAVGRLGHYRYRRPG